MASPDVRPGISAFSAVGAPPREAPPPVLPQTKVKPTPAPELLPEPKKRKPFSGRKLLVRLGLALAAVAGGLGYQHHVENQESFSVPGITRDAAGIPSTAGQDINTLLRGLGINARIGKPAVSETFDNTRESQTIEAGVNTISVTQDELPALMRGSIKPVVKGQRPYVSIPLPIELNNGQEVKVSTNYINGANWMKGGQVERLVRGKEIIVAKKGTRLFIPIENAQVFQIEYQNLKNQQSYLPGAVVRFKGPDDTPYEISIHARNDVEVLRPTDAFSNAPVMKGMQGIYLAGANLNPEMKGLMLPLGTAIMETTVDNAHIYLEVGTLASEVSTAKVNSTSVVLIDFNLLTRNKNGYEKIITLASP